eukprot:1075837-Pyramimonas_sp.AAC.1
MIKRIAKTSRLGVALVKTGYLPQASWGLESQCVAPSRLLKMRAQVSGMVGRKEGGCATTTIRTSFPSAHQDPL